MDSRIISDLKASYGIRPLKITPVMGGWLNPKWKISTANGDLLVKQYSAERFSRAQLEKLEAALQRQVILEKIGVSCPRLLQFKNRVIRWADDETAYMVMDFCPGRTETPETITTSQMHSLGEACAVMHAALAQIQAAPDERLPVFGGYTLDLLWKNFSSRVSECPPDSNSEYEKALLSMEPILKCLSPEFFEKFQKGFAHEDFQPGNILFEADRVFAIVDFDRCCYSYVLHDVGRAILSFALKNDMLNIENIRDFLEGYSRYRALTLADIADALRLSWCIETTWWVQPEFFGECDAIPRRFRDEMLWLTEHWFELDSLLRL